jgi:hypothetical protein
MSRLANVSIDLDGLGCYHTIHRLAEAADPTLMYTLALPRFRELFAELGIKATLFVITSDLEHEAVVRELRLAVDEGHEVASHTHSHPYNLREWTDARIAAELKQSEDALFHAVGVRPVGFRTPGYNVDTRILRILAERGYTYDSSVFPCPPYYLAKAAVMGVMALSGKPSGSSMTDPAALLAPLQPYRPSRFNFSRPGDATHSLPLWEIPMGVVRGVRVPVIGTSIGAVPAAAARAMARALKLGQPTVQLEFHGIDMLDRDDVGIVPSLAGRQPDLRRAWRAKRAAYHACFSEIALTHRFMTLQQLVEELDRTSGSSPA